MSRIRHAIVVTILLTACSTTGAPPTPDPLAGTYTGFGSATTLDQAQVVTAAFAKLHPGVTFHRADLITIAANLGVGLRWP